MKKTWTRILSLACVAALVLSFAACNTDKENEGQTTDAVTPGVSDSATPAPDETLPSGATEAPSATGTADPSSNVPSSTDKSGKPVAPSSTKPTAKPTNGTSVADVVKVYNAAANASNKSVKKTSIINVSNLKLGSIKNKLIDKAIDNLVSKNQTTADGLPGDPGTLKASDVSSAKMTVSGNQTRIQMSIKGQTNGPKTEWNNGPCGRAIGVLGDVQSVLDQAGASFYDGGTATLKYTNATVDVTIVNGKIVSGTYKQRVDVTVQKVKLVLKIPSASGTVNFTYTVK